MDEAPHTPASAFGLKGRRALVTGGSSGIGRATSELLRDLGCDVHVLDLDPFSAPPGTTGHECDLAVTASVNAAVDAAAGDRGIHVLVNCAAIGAFGDISTSSDEEWARVLNVNVIGLARVFRAALPHLRVAGDAGVVVLGSIAAWLGVPRRAVYSASKGAVQALALAFAADHISEGIRVNVVNPATVDTPWVQRMVDSAADSAAERRSMEARQPHGRLVLPDEVAWAIAHLVSPRAGSTTGTILAVDGGMHTLRIR